MNQLEDDQFGKLKYDFGWHGTYRFVFFGQECDRLSVPGEENVPISMEQRSAFANFIANRESLLTDAEDAILAYYSRIHDELLERLGGDAIRMAPFASSKSDMAALVHPTGLLVQEPLHGGERMIGILCDCTWEPNLGLAVRIVNERVTDVGDQDIVL